jgi:hypothetical protein
MATYKGAKKIKQLPCTKKKYNRKNDAGGRKAVFSQSKEYKRKCNISGHWASGVTKGAREWGT